MSRTGYQLRERARKVGVNQEAHGKLGGWRRMKRFLLCDLAHESQGSPYILGGEIVVALDFFKGHAACKATDHNWDGHARTTYYRLPMVDCGVDYDAI
jgi:hypothetical protein